MKLRMTLLASVCLIAPAQAADNDVLAALDTCGALDITGLAVSSDIGCVDISGSVYYEFYWGNYEKARDLIGANPLAYSGDYVTIANPGPGQDWSSYYDIYLTFAGASGSDAGTAKAVVQLYNLEDLGIINNAIDHDDQSLDLELAYVSVGDATVLSAGKQETVARLDDDEAFGWLPTYLSDDAEGVAFDSATGGTFETEGHAIQLVADLGNGLSIGGGLEALEASGSALGFVGYASETMTAHATVLAGDILDGTLNDFALHAGATAIFSNGQLRAAVAANSTGWWNGLLSGELAAGLFTLDATIDATSEREWGGVAAVSMQATDVLVLQAALRYLDSDTAIADDEGLEQRLRAEYSITETLTLALEGGHLGVGAGAVHGSQSIYDALLEAAWDPNADGSLKLTTGLAANTLGAYKMSLTAYNEFK